MKILTKSQAALITELAVSRLVEYVKESNLKSLVLGISGGMDSAVVGALGIKAAKRLIELGYHVEVHYSFLDVKSDPYDLVRALEMSKSFGFILHEYDLTNWYLSSPLLQEIPAGHPRAKIAEGNIKCRLRMIALYHFAQITGGIYLDTDDLSEEYMGFWTKHGDEGDVKIIQHLTKDEVYDLGEYLGVPASIQNSQPGDGLKVTENNQASDQLGLPYLYIDYVISRFLQNGFDTEGKFSQLKDTRYIELIQQVADEINKSDEAVYKVLEKSLKTAFKRRYGDNVAHLLPNRLEMNLPVIGTEDFNKLYLAAIKKTQTLQ